MFCGSLRMSTRKRSLIVMPGVTMRKASENPWSPGRRARLTACQAMIIPITVVLPEPVAILQASR